LKRDADQAAAAASVREIDARSLHTRLAADSPPLLVDLREPYPRMVAHIAGSRHIPYGQLASRFPEELPDRSAFVVLLCTRGRDSYDACLQLQRSGYTNLHSLAGGLNEWERAGLPMERPAHPGGREWAPRYARQLCLPEVGPEGQKRLLAARVLIVGVGGLGSPAAMYLAAAGVGRIGLVDHEQVDVTNLHRQILYRESSIGAPKVFAAQSALGARNPDVNIVAHHDRFTAANAEAIARAYDLIVDGADNFATRYLVNDICCKLDLPNVHGSIHRLEGQVSIFCRPGGPCYRCIHPEPPPDGWVPSCAEAGVLGVLPGVIGTLQATEVVKLITGIGEPLVGRVLRFEALKGAFETFRVGRRSDCAWCDPGGGFPGLADYDRLCGAS
jgi:molybdopterin/thiamine biosynthesis adenylyltransferase/rhodanese-related sulfurtransferase